MPWEQALACEQKRHTRLLLFIQAFHHIRQSSCFFIVVMMSDTF
jgi:hypothetical protein